MKYLFFSMLIGTGAFLYISSSQGKPGTGTLSLTIPGVEKVAAPAPDDDATAADASQEQRMVQIHGKWYSYRADNRYVIDGVPTYHVAKKIESRKPASAAPQTQVAAAPAKSVQNEKTQKLAKMAADNPLAVYTPEGFQTLKDGLEAAQNGAADRKKALEELTRDP